MSATRSRALLDKEPVKREILRVCAHYLGPGRSVGTRTVWPCPRCSKQKFEANAGKGVAGCWNAECEAPTTTDAIGVIAFFEGLEPRGKDFARVLERGYELLGLGQEERGPSDAGRSPGEAAHRPGDKEAAGEKGRWRTGAGSGWGAAPGPEERSPREAGRDARAEEPRREDAGGTIVEHEEVIEGEVLGEELIVGEERPVRAHRETKTGLRGRAEAWVVGPELRGADLADTVYSALLDLCPLEDRDVRFWENRGVSHQTMRSGMFGSTTARRTRWAVKVLAKRFGQEALLSVPGFSKNRWGRLSFTLTGDYALIPYLDADMRVVTIEGRHVGDGEGIGKYVSLRNSTPHLYVFPGIMPDRLEAFCEGPVGAIMAAQEGIPVGAIKGHRNYKMPGFSGGPLPELEGVDFKGRLVPYIPDLDVKPKTREAVLSDAPKAAHHLTALQNGRAALVALPEGKDLDEWLLSMKKGGRRAAFTDLIARAIPLEKLAAEGESRKEQEPIPSQVPAEPTGAHTTYDHWAEDLPPEGLATRGELGAALAVVVLVFACVLFALLRLLPPATLPGAVAGHPFAVACVAGLLAGAWLWSEKRRTRLKTARHLRD